MTATTDRPDGGDLGPEDATSKQSPQPQKNDWAQFIVCAVLVVVGAFLIFDALTLAGGFAKVDPVGPKLFPLVVGSGLLLCAVILAIAITRGSKGEADEGEDIDPDSPGDWKTVGMLVGLFVATIALVDFLGWAITGGMLFAGAATVLGSRHYVRNIVIGGVLSVVSFYAFYSGLGIPLPAGILDGIL
ncbi:tripartite tricarboxylate transporter TctB family protein [Antrihabitans spumae]|uniref:Tripartite tricarboxylate transporter TctB family protein n=1 Tax=Antrihabitans spumae TaxID=3373370 RepID=A0ABW7K6V9_9NOCA